MPSSRFRFPHHFVAKALHLPHNRRDKPPEGAVDDIRSGDRQFDRIRHESEQADRVRIAVDQARGVEQVRDADLVRRRALAHRIRDIRPIDPDQRSGRSIRAIGIYQNHVIRVRQQT